MIIPIAIFAHRLGETIPPALSVHVNGGLTKSAMNTFAGIRAAIRSNCQTVFAKGSHFEFIEMIGENHTVEDLKTEVEKANVDLYLGEFNHNVSLYADNLYTSGNPIHEIELLIKARPAGGKPLTAAIDCTIDFVNSKRAAQLLFHFQEAILEGKLNLIFFQSGQKYWLFGMDHVYGSPFYMVNNRAAIWETFDQLYTRETYKTDSLTRQWFCLANKYVPNSDIYRKAIFQNTRALLDNIPKALLPENKGAIIVSRVAKDVETGFIDIKCFGERSQGMAYALQELLYRRFTAQGAILYSRAGYGYFHPNLVKFMNGFDNQVRYATLRITLGIDPRDNEILLAFLEDAVKLAEEIKTA